MVTKRIFDIVFSASGLLVLSPLFIVIALVIKLTSEGTVFYRPFRVGRNGMVFELYKFRTMIPDAARIGPPITHSNDSRITSVGKILRQTKLDELPQLLNVLRGDMSIVGPRPEDPVYVRYYTDDQKRLLQVRPGITSLASIEYRDEEKLLTPENWEQTYLKEVLPAKLAIDLVYVDKGPSILRDLHIIVKTLARVVF